MIRILFVGVGKRPEVREIDGELETMQKLVGGYIQMVPMGNGVDLVCDEEGKLKDYPLNQPIFDGHDIVCGDFFLTRTGDEGECISLTDDDIKKYTDMFT